MYWGFKCIFVLSFFSQILSLFLYPSLIGVLTNSCIELCCNHNCTTFLSFKTPCQINCIFILNELSSLNIPLSKSSPVGPVWAEKQSAHATSLHWPSYLCWAPKYTELWAIIIIFWIYSWNIAYDMYGMSLGQNKSEKSEKAAHFVPRLMLGFHLRQAGI